MTNDSLSDSELRYGRMELSVQNESKVKNNLEERTDGSCG
jgi:hypothetical protein